MTVVNQSKQTPAIASLWDDSAAASMSEPELLLYRSNLLGSDLRITHFGGGTTSAATRKSRVLWESRLRLPEIASTRIATPPLRARGGSSG